MRPRCSSTGARSHNMSSLARCDLTYLRWQGSNCRQLPCSVTTWHHEHICSSKLCKLDTNWHGLATWGASPSGIPTCLAMLWRFVGQNADLEVSSTCASRASAHTDLKGVKQVSSNTTQAFCLATALALRRSAFAASPGKQSPSGT